ncbi:MULTISPECIES: glutathione S-transferase family protein [Kordiimonas]|jgi:glutathione S-transferase|uniref:glutathione S-transferase family protein n=1 Tax=Kordiimonas TaxID=288021 RepID=UPI0025797343|nr:glutathione S-transferase family protein [Kordiimonas sp. UBA4487]
MITLFWCPNTRAIRSLWLLEEMGCDFSTELVDIRDAEAPRSDAFRRASPMGKVPAILDGDVALSDSTAIALYLLERFPNSALDVTEGGQARADFLYWMQFMGSVMEPAMAEKFSSMEAKKYVHAWGDFDTMISLLEGRLEGREWIMGDQFTAADVLIGATCYFLRLFGSMPESELLHAYTDRCMARPAFARATGRT